MQPALDSLEPPCPADLLVARARRRDPQAFEELYRLHHRRIYGLALRLARDAGRAEELTQDAFVRAWEILPGFRGDSSFATWLHGLTVRVFLEHSRAERRRTERFEAADDLDIYLAEVRRALPETSLALEKAVAGLPDGARCAPWPSGRTAPRHRNKAGRRPSPPSTVRRTSLCACHPATPASARFSRPSPSPAPENRLESAPCAFDSGGLPCNSRPAQPSP